jgi:hypothetical protein
MVAQPQPALLGAVASERYTRQIVSRGVGVATSENPAGAVSMPVAWPPAGVVAAQTRTFLTVGLKPGTANLGNVPTPAGWTKLVDFIGGGYGATLGVNTGNVRVFLFSKDGDNTSAGTLSVGLTPDGANGVAVGIMQRIEKLSGTWQPVVTASAEFTTNGTEIALFSVPTMKVSRGDFLIYGFAITNAFVGGTVLTAGPGLDGLVPSLAANGGDSLGFRLNAVCTGRRALRGLVPITDPQIHTVGVPGVNNRGPMVVARMRVR